ncbi:hypothetical protein ZWY2020_017317 [Hordeum vulgare]|nr:hypothetical protein ZWY2020_017317 [Hordeum vulgare]
MDTAAAAAPSTVSSDDFRVAYGISTSWMVAKEGLFGDGELVIHHPQLNPPCYHSIDHLRYLSPVQFVLIIHMTLDVWQLLDTRIHVRFPDLEASTRSRPTLVKRRLYKLSGGDFQDFTRQTEGFSYMDIVVCVSISRAANLRCVCVCVLAPSYTMYHGRDDDDDDDLSVNNWIPCCSEELGALRWTMHELAMVGFRFSSQINSEPGDSLLADTGVEILYGSLLGLIPNRELE